MANRNEAYDFSVAPSVDIQRTTFPINHSVKTSFNAGSIVPFYCSEILPGDT